MTTTATATPGSVTPLITAAEVPQNTRDKVARLFNNQGITVEALRAAAAGVSIEGYRKANPEVVMPTILDEIENSTALIAFYKLNPKHYATVALQIYTESFINDAVESAYPELAAGSVPDATGNDAEETTAELCPLCNKVH